MSVDSPSSEWLVLELAVVLVVVVLEKDLLPEDLEVAQLDVDPMRLEVLVAQEVPYRLQCQELRLDHLPAGSSPKPELSEVPEVADVLHSLVLVLDPELVIEATAMVDPTCWCRRQGRCQCWRYLESLEYGSASYPRPPGWRRTCRRECSKRWHLPSWL